jgi:hypothetical protein
MTRIEKARDRTKRAKESYLRGEREGTIQAEIYAEVIDEDLWDVDFKSLEEWLAAIGKHGVSQAYAMARNFREGSKFIPTETLSEIPYVNLRDVLEVPESKRTAEMVQDAKDLTNNQLRETLNKAVPGLALEQRNYKGFPLEESERDVVMRAINLAKAKEEIKSESTALEYICQQYLSAEGDTPHFRAAQAVMETAEEQINPENLSAPPDAIGWGAVLVSIRRMARVFGFPEKRVMGKSDPIPVTTERVQ